MTKSRILIVDDKVPNLQLLGNILKDRYSLSFASSGREALGILEKSRPDLILLDVMMPEIDGFEVCRRIRRNPVLEDIPVIFLTAKTDRDSVVKGRKVGGQDYVVKPFMADDVIQRISKQLDQPQKDSIGEDLYYFRKTEPFFSRNRYRNTKYFLSHCKRKTSGTMKEIEEELDTIIQVVPVMTGYISDLEGLMEDAETAGGAVVKEKLERVRKDRLNSDLTTAIHTMHDNLQNLQFRLLDFLADNRPPDEDNGKNGAFQLFQTLSSLQSFLPDMLKMEMRTLSDPLVRGKPELFLQMVISLLDNGVDAMTESGKKPDLLLTVEPCEHRLAVVLQDNGPGLPGEQLEFLADPYFTTRKDRMGLGLTVTDLIVRNEFRGKLLLENHYGCRASLIFSER